MCACMCACACACACMCTIASIAQKELIGCVKIIDLANVARSAMKLIDWPKYTIHILQVETECCNHEIPDIINPCRQISSGPSSADSTHRWAV